MRTTDYRLTGSALADLLDISRETVPPDTYATGTPTPAELWTYSYREIPGGLHGTACELFTTAGDVYQAIDAFTDRRAVRPAGVYALAAVSYAWAAPTGPGEPMPSEHPQRRRVRIAAFTDDGGQVCTRLTFTDTGETHDDGDGRGHLADILRAAIVAR